MPDKGPTTDHSLGIQHVSQTKFRDIRAKAKKDEEERHLKAKRKKDKKIPLPKYKIGEEIVLARSHSWRAPDRSYYLVDVIDFDQRSPYGSFMYYGILKRTTDPEGMERLGRLVHFQEASWWSSDYSPANVPNEKINWKLTDGE